MALHPTPSSSASRVAFIVGTALLAGTLDITAAMTNFAVSSGRNPLQVLPYVASGVFGKAAFNGSPTMLVWGLVFHFGIALAFTVFYFWLYLRLAWLGRHPVLGGLLYGIAVWLVMNRVVVPLSQVPVGPFNLTQALINAGILMLCIGLPISLLAHRYYRRHSAQGL